MSYILGNNMFSTLSCGSCAPPPLCGEGMPPPSWGGGLFFTSRICVTASIMLYNNSPPRGIDPLLGGDGDAL